jgi:hypothetical protein
MKLYSFFLLFSLLLTACQNEHPFDTQKVVDSSIEAHGLKLLEGHTVRFDFRRHSYSLSRTVAGNRYTRTIQQDSSTIEDVLTTNGSFKRRINDQVVKLADSTASKYSESINSVAYFFLLPLPLNDAAVIKEAMGIEQINNKEYYKIKVSFKQEGGGTDFEDEFRYWIGKEDSMLDYLAYSYQTNGGGIRFRQAINRRVIDGLVVQDYINYRPKDKTTPLDSLPALFEQGKLIEVSRIEKKNISLLPSTD